MFSIAASCPCLQRRQCHLCCPPPTFANVLPTGVTMWARQLASTMVRLHALGVIHRDIKDSNVMISTDDDRCILVRRISLLRCKPKQDPTYRGSLYFPLVAPLMWVLAADDHACERQVDLGLAIRLPMPSKGDRPTCATHYQSDQRVGVLAYMAPEVSSPVIARLGIFTSMRHYCYAPGRYCILSSVTLLP